MFYGKISRFPVKPKISTIGSITEVMPGSPKNVGTQISFVHDDSIRDLLGFKPILVDDKY